jgi:uncharacterized protein (TIGR00251 family)
VKWVNRAYNNASRLTKRKLINSREQDGSITFEVRAIPRSSKSEIVGEHDGALKVKLNTPPVDGAANDELVTLLAREFGVSKHEVQVVSGLSSKTKRICIRVKEPGRIAAILKAKS